MQGTVTHRNHCWVISYKGDSTGIFSGILPEVSEAIRSGATSIILDLEKLKSINRIGTRAILDTIQHAKIRNVNICILSPTPEVRRILKLNGLTTETPIYNERARAIREIDLLDYCDDNRHSNADALLICQKCMMLGRYIRKSLNSQYLKPTYRLCIARDMDQAFSMLRKEKISCVILDASMPILHFENFIDKIQGEPDFPTVPILVVASDEHMPTAEIMIRHGAHDLIRYPFTASEINIRLQNLISYLFDGRTLATYEDIPRPRGFKA